MKINVTNRPLHEVILQIMYLENQEKAAEMSSSDILWRIENPEISERQVREVLEWLLHHQRVLKYLNKYALDRSEFLVQKEIYKTDQPEPEPEKKAPSNNHGPNNSHSHTTFYINPPKKTKKDNIPKYVLIFLSIGLCFLSYLTYALYQYQNESLLLLTTLENEHKTSLDTTSLRSKKVFYETDKGLSGINESHFEANPAYGKYPVIEELKTNRALLDSLNSASHNNKIFTQQAMGQLVKNSYYLFLRIIVTMNFMFFILCCIAFLWVLKKRRPDLL